MNNFINTNTYKDIIKNKIHCIFVSPHLDDAIFSAGGLMQSLSKKGVPLTLVNVFTKASKPPYTISIKKFLSSCGYDNADNLFKDRISEDLTVAKQIKAKVINLGFTDALWRKKKSNYFIPELNYVYPIFRLSIARGLISKNDQHLFKDIENSLHKIIKAGHKSVIFCPIGIGKHTDHLIVRDVVSKNFNNLVFWEDYPYSETNTADLNFLKQNRLVEKKYIFNKNIKNNLVNGYRSQISAIFGKGVADTKNSESYYFDDINNDFPKTIDEYKFNMEIHSHEQIGTYSIALYSGDNNKKVIAKRWLGTKKDASYMWLKNEINAYKLLNQKDNTGNIRIPRLIKTIETKNSLIMLIDYIDAKNIAKLTVKNKVNAYASILKFMHNIDVSKSKDIVKRGPIFWLAILPIITIKAVIIYPAYLWPMTKAFVFALLFAPSILFRNKRCLVHRDLNDNNVFKNKKNLHLIDFELTSIADPMIDWAILLLKYSNNRLFLTTLKNTEPAKKIITNNYALSTYIIIFAIYDLTFEKGLHKLDIKFLSSLKQAGQLP